MKTSSRYRRFVALAFAALLAAASANAADTVLAHWPFTNGSLEDESGNNHTIEVGEAVVTSGGCLSFPENAVEGTSWAQTTDAITMSGSKNATVSLWLRQPTSTADASILELSANPTGTTGAFQFGWLESRKVSFSYRATSGLNTREISTGVFDDGEWHQVVATMFIGGKKTTPTVTLYVDGKLDSTSTANAITANVTGGDTFKNDKFYFARRAGSEGTGGSFAGDIGEVAVYGEVLSAACMQTNYYRELGRVYKGDSAKYQSRLPDGWRVDAQGVFSYRVRVISDRGISLGGDVRSAGTNEFWFVENEINTLTVAAAADGERIAWSGVPTTATFDAKGEAASFAVTEPLEMSVSSFTPTHVWTGAAGTDFKADGNWADASGAETAAPGTDARVFIPVGALNQPTAGEAISVGELRIGSLTNGTQKATFTSSTTAAHQIAGDMVVYACGVMTHPVGNYKVNLACGNMSIERGGAVDVNAKGDETKGRPSKSQAESSYGGRGTTSWSTLCYGNIRQPTDRGSKGGGSSDYGGGVVRLNVAGTLRVDGRISSDGAHVSRAGSGGSIWLTAGTLVGGRMGTITALEELKKGGGGRIAIYQTATATRTAFTGTIDAGNGTLYREDLGDTPGIGELILTGKDNRPVEFNKSVTGCSTPFKKFTFTGTGHTLIIMDNIHVTVCGGIQAAGNTVKSDVSYGVDGKPSGDGIMGTIDLQGAKEGVTHLSGTFLLGGFTCTNGTDTLEIGKGTTLSIRNTGKLELFGSAETSLTMLSAEPSWNLTLGTDLDMTVKYVAASNSIASATVSDVGGTDLGGNENWLFPEMPKEGDPITWTGLAGTAWALAENWQDENGGNRLPTEADAVIIPAGCPAYPMLSADAVSFNRLQIASGGRLTVENTVVSVATDIACEGSLILTGNASVSVAGDVSLASGALSAGTATSFILAGAAAQTIDGRGNRFNRLTVACPNVTFTNGLSVVSLACEQPGRDVSLLFSAGDTYAADTLRLKPGANGSLTLGSTKPGASWKLCAGPSAACDGVIVSDCDASGGHEILVSDYTDSGRNSNWRKVAFSMWTGANSTAWSDPENWTDGVPAETNDVRILPTATGNMPTLSDATAVRSLTVGDGSGAVTLTLSKSLTVSDSMRVNAGATVVANQPVVVTNDMYVAAGATLTHALGAKLDISCGGNMTIEKDGAVDVNEKGNSTKGRTNNNQGRASYGGLGNMGLQCYGDIRKPNDLGSCGMRNNTMAGGAVRLTVAGTLRVEGAISSNGRRSGVDTGDGAGSGGSVWLTVGSLTGGGSITAWEEARWGGGGRIAIYQTATATRTAFTGTIYVDNGTLYREDLGDAPGVGELILQGTRVVELSTQVVGSSEPFKKITFEGAGQTMIIMDNIPVTVCGDILASGNAILADISNGKGTGNMGTIDVLGAAEGVTHVSGNITVGRFTCTNGTAALEFAAGKTLTVRDNGTLWLEGRVQQKLALKSSVPGEYWFINAGTNLTGRTRFLNVSDSNAHGGEKITARSSVGKRAHNDNWAFPGGIALIIK